MPIGLHGSTRGYFADRQKLAGRCHDMQSDLLSHMSWLVTCKDGKAGMRSSCAARLQMIEYMWRSPQQARK